MFDLQSNLAFAALRSFSASQPLTPLSSPYQQNYYYQNNDIYDNTFKIDNLANIIETSITNSYPPLPQRVPQKVAPAINKYQSQDKRYRTRQYYPLEKKTNNLIIKKDSLIKIRDKISTDKDDKKRIKEKTQNYLSYQNYYDKPIPFQYPPSIVPTPKQNPKKGSTNYKKYVDRKNDNQINYGNFKYERKTSKNTKNEFSRRLTASEMDLILQ